MADPTDPKNPSNPTLSIDPKSIKDAEQFVKYFDQLRRSVSEIKTELDEVNQKIKDGKLEGKSTLEINLQQKALQREYDEKRLQALEYELSNKKELTEEEKRQLQLKISLLRNDIEIGKVQEKSLGQWTAINDMAGSMLGSMTGITGRAETLLSSIAQASFEGGGFGGAMNAAAVSIDKMGSQFFNIKNLLLASIDAAVELAKQQDAAFADFEKNVGDAKKYEDQIWSLTQTNGAYGISVMEAGKAYADLKKEIPGFDQMSKSTQNALAETSAQLEKLGISSADTNKSLGMLTKGFGMTGQQAATFQKQLYATAKAMGLPPAQAAKDFATAAPRLAAYGKGMTKVFLDLQKSAQNTGIEFNRLMAMTSKFDTFEGAAEAAGHLNAILGGDLLNSVELMNADEGERIRLMQDALKMSGKTFDSMSKQEKMAVAQAMGIEDLTELQKLMNNENKKSAIDLMNQEKAQKSMNEAIEEATQLTDMFKTLTLKLGTFLGPVIRPIMTLLKSMIKIIIEGFDALSSLWDMMAELISPVGGLIGWLSEKWTNFYNIISPGIIFITNIWNSLVSAFKQIPIIGEFFSSAGSQVSKFVDNIIKVGKAALVIYVLYEIWQAAASKVKRLVKDMSGSVVESVADAGKKVGDVAQNQVQKAMDIAGESAEKNGKKIGGGLGDAIKKVGTSAKENAAGLLALGAAFLMIGAGIGIAAVGLAQLAKAFADLQGEQIAGALGALIIVMGGFAGMLYLLTGAALPAAPALLALGAAFLMIGAGTGIAAVGLSVLVNAFAQLNPEQTTASLIALGIVMGGFTLIIAGFAAAAALMGPALVLAAPGLLALGGAITLIGAGVGIAAAGIGYMANAVANLFNALAKANAKNIKDAFSAIFDSLSLTGIAKLTSFAGAVDDLSKPLENLASKLTSATNKIKEFSNIGVTLSADVTKIKSLTESIISLSEALSKPINDSLSKALQNISESIEEMSVIKIAALATVSTAMTKPTVGTTTAAAITANPALTPGPRSAAQTGTAAGGASGTVETKMVPVAIYIDGKKLGEILDPSIKKTIDGKLNQIGGTGKIIPDVR